MRSFLSFRPPNQRRIHNLRSWDGRHSFFRPKERQCLKLRYVSREVFAGIPLGQAASSIGGVYDRLIAARPGSVRGFLSHAHYWDIGTVTDYWQTSWMFLPGHASSIGAAARIASSAAVTRSILWDEVEVSERAALDECIVTDGVRVPSGVSYRRAILMRTPDGQLSATPFATD